jgi:group II intron reverse transcriptase/maturase
MLFKHDIYIAAYEKIKSSPGYMTEGSDGETIDGFSLKKIDKIIEEMKTSTFQFKPAKRVEIPKAYGKKRPLGIPSTRDKVVQAAMLMILESIYDGPRPYFLECSHGFRPNKSTHTALEQYRKTWHGTTWILEGDIKACFDEIDHQILVEIIRRKINDDRFIQLLWKSLKAGYMEFKTGFHNTVSGTPQGSIISPILANIYLHELDVHVMSIVKRENKGEKRKANPEYRSLVRKRQRLIKVKGVEADAPEVR